MTEPYADPASLLHFCLSAGLVQWHCMPGGRAGEIGGWVWCGTPKTSNKNMRLPRQFAVNPATPFRSLLPGVSGG